MTTKDFEGLSIPKLTKKLKEVENLEFLSELEQWEKDNEDRTGAKKAINERQGELIELQEAEVKEESKKPETDESETETSSDGADEASEETDTDDEEDREGDTLAVDGTDEQAGEIEVEEEEEVKSDIDIVKDLRRQTNHLIRCCDAHLRVPKEISDKLAIGRSWMGVVLGELGNKNPYDVEVKQKQDIPPLAEAEETNHMKAEARQFSYKNHLDALLEMRKMLDDLEKDWFAIEDSDFNDKAMIAHMQAWVHIREAKFILGMELGALRDR